MTLSEITLICKTGFMNSSESNKKNPLGPTGEQLKENLGRLRGRMTYKELAEKLAAVGRPIPPLGLRRIEHGERRVDADDLVALALVLNVNPSALLLPHVESAETVDLTEEVSVSFKMAWQWADGRSALENIQAVAPIDFLATARPRMIQPVKGTATEAEVKKLMKAMGEQLLELRRLGLYEGPAPAGFNGEFDGND